MTTAGRDPIVALELAGANRDAVALSFQSPVSIFAFECVIALAVYLLLTCFERDFWWLDRCGGGGEHSDTLHQQLNVRDVFSAGFSIQFCFLF